MCCSSVSFAPFEAFEATSCLAEPLFKPASYLFDRFPNQAMTSRPLGEVCNGEPLPLFNLAFVCRFNTFFATEICGNFVA
jgi:hypothetical protein